jgi:hypothetical protein
MSSESLSEIYQGSKDDLDKVARVFKAGCNYFDASVSEYVESTVENNGKPKPNKKEFWARK